MKEKTYDILVKVKDQKPKLVGNSLFPTSSAEKGKLSILHFMLVYSKIDVVFLKHRNP